MIESVETSKIRCKVCGDDKTRYLNGKWDGVNKKWVDEAGKAWNGHTCPKCHKDKCKEVMRKKRVECVIE